MNKLDEFCKLIDGCESELIDTVTVINLAREIFNDKPTLKPVDLSVLIERGIDCEVDGHDFYNIGPLVDYHSVNRTSTLKQGDLNVIVNGDRLRPRMTPFIHASPNGFDSCPLPDGLKIKVYFNDGAEVHESSILEWSHIQFMSDCNIIAFEVLGLADGFCWPWEADDE